MVISIKQLDRIGAAIVVSSLILCTYLAVHAGVNQKREIARENEQDTKLLRDLETVETNLQHINKALEAARRGLQTQKEKIPEKVDIGLFLKELGNLMEKRNIALVSVQPQPSIREKLYTRIPIHMVFKGAFLKVYQVINDLEGMRRKVVLEKIAINRNETSEECQVDLILNIFEK